MFFLAFSKKGGCFFFILIHTILKIEKKMFLNRIPKCRSFLKSTRWTLKRSLTLPATTDKASIEPLIKQQQEENKNDTEAWNGLMSQLAGSGRSAQAQQLYDSIFRSHGTLANMATFYHLMLAYINNGQFHDAMEIYYEIRDHEASPQDTVKNLHLDEHMYNQLVASLAEKSKTSEKKQYIHEEVFGSTIEDEDAFLYNEDSQPELLAALSLLKDMRQSDMTPTNAMYISLLNAGAHHKDSFVVHRVHTLIRMDPYFEPGAGLYTTLMHAYRCIGEGDVVMDLWDRYQTGLDVMVDTCVQFHYQQRLQHLWQQCKAQLTDEQTQRVIETVAITDNEQAERIQKEAVENGNIKNVK
jgi:tetratricopeptide (TPR) repeat protein